MYVARRDLRAARGRFALIASVVALITLLVGFLSGLTGGLAAQNVSAVLALPGEHVVLAASSGGDARFGDSALAPDVVAAWRRAPGVTSVVPVGLTRARAVTDDAPVAVTVVGLEHDRATGLTRLAPPTAAGVGLSKAAAAQLGVGPGGSVTIGGASLTVTTVGDDLWYAHSPVVVVDRDRWSAIDRGLGGGGEPTALGVSGTPDYDAVAAATGTAAPSRLGSLRAVETFSSEVGSLALMIGLLLVISALVVGAFFTVWTLQRAGDVAVLAALGATRLSLAADALGQALVVLGLGVGVGVTAVVVLGSLTPDGLPFLLSPLTTVVPAAMLTVLGLAGASVTLRTITRTDPLSALGSHR